MQNQLIDLNDPELSQFEYIGRGMTSTVYRAYSESLRGPVAVKVLNPHLHTDQIAIERFRRELQITQKIQHPSIAKVLDLRSTKTHHYLIMEFVSGETLKDYVRRKGPLPIDETLSYIKTILQVLQACHKQNIIHRDLKSLNIIITPTGELKLLDFGIARMTSLSDLTQTGSSIGTPEYMAPELFSANIYDPRTDLYALGIISHEMLAGELPFQSDSLAVLFKEHLENPLPPVVTRADLVPEWLVGFNHRLTAKNPYHRYQSALEALDDFEKQNVTPLTTNSLRKRPCLYCAHETIKDLEFCTHCGRLTFDGFGDGPFVVRNAQRNPPEKVLDFLNKAFELNKKNALKDQAIAANIDQESANQLCELGKQFQLHFNIEKTHALDQFFQMFSAISRFIFVWAVGFAILFLLSNSIKRVVFFDNIFWFAGFGGFAVSSLYALYRLRANLPLMGQRLGLAEQIEMSFIAGSAGLMFALVLHQFDGFWFTRIFGLLFPVPVLKLWKELAGSRLDDYYGWESIQEDLLGVSVWGLGPLFFFLTLYLLKNAGRQKQGNKDHFQVIMHKYRRLVQALRVSRSPDMNEFVEQLFAKALALKKNSRFVPRAERELLLTGIELANLNSELQAQIQKLQKTALRSEEDRKLLAEAEEKSSRLTGHIIGLNTLLNLKLNDLLLGENAKSDHQSPSLGEVLAELRTEVAATKESQAELIGLQGRAS